LRVYENIVIGNFLFDLGVRMAKLRAEFPLVSVDLLQQTPSDMRLGDVLLANAGVCRLIELQACRAAHKQRTAKAEGTPRRNYREFRAQIRFLTRRP
jgi:hypothetical protein